MTQTKETLQAYCSVIDREDAVMDKKPFEDSVPVTVELLNGLTFEEALSDEDVLLFEKSNPLVWLFVRVAKGRYQDALDEFGKEGYLAIGYAAVRSLEDENEV